MGGKKVAAPWESRPDQWIKYGEDRRDKYEKAWGNDPILTEIKGQAEYKAANPNQQANMLKRRFLSEGKAMPRTQGKPKLV